MTRLSMTGIVSNLLIIACAGVANGWLLIAKVLPALAPGLPPGYQAYYTTAASEPIPVGWTVVWNDRSVGSAASITTRTPLSGLVVHSHLRLEHLPLGDLLPSWSKTFLGTAVDMQQRISLEATSRLEIDPRGRLEAFHSLVALPGGVDRVRLRGRVVAENDVEIKLEVGGVSYTSRRYLPQGMLMGDELSPQAMLPGLTPGRRWTVPVYSPLRPAHTPVQILHAEVTGVERMYWDEKLVRVDVVSYRDDPSHHHEPRCRMWVDPTGRVLRQEAILLGSKIEFVRLGDEAAARMAAGLEERIRSFEEGSDSLHLPDVLAPPPASPAGGRGAAVEPPSLSPPLAQAGSRRSRWPPTYPAARRRLRVHA